MINTTDFKNVFGIGDDITVPQSVVDTYEKYVEGSSLLFKYLFDSIDKYEFLIEERGFNFKFKPVKVDWFYGNLSFNDFVKGFTSGFRIELKIENSSYFTKAVCKKTFKWLNGRGVSQNNFNREIHDLTPFNREDEDLFILNLFKKAYLQYTIKLDEEIKRYRNDYGVTMKYSYYTPRYLYGVGASTPIHFTGVKFLDDLIVYNESEPIRLQNYNITLAIEKQKISIV
jgi:hypothetical protein